jgi:hypothetical protein
MAPRTEPRWRRSVTGLGSAVSAQSPLEPRDPVFFETSTSNITNANMIGAHTGAIVRIQPYDWTDLVGTTRAAGRAATGRAGPKMPGWPELSVFGSAPSSVSIAPGTVLA